MTELIITPKVQDKTARFKGAIAAGEHVAVTIKGGAEWIGEDDGANLMLRVIDLITKRTLAVFPRPPETLAEGETFAEGENEWDSDEADLTCTLNLNTARMVNAARHMITVPVLFVLGDTDNPRTLYFRDQYEVEYWPERIGDDVPYDLDRWPKQIDDWTALVAEWQSQMTAFGTTLTGHVGNNNIHVTAEQKIAWTNKQDAIADLEAIRAGAAKGATALQEHQDISGKADLVGGKVPQSQLPSYVDDVLEYASAANFPATGEEGKIYVAKDENKTYRWSGSQYVQIGGDGSSVTVDPTLSVQGAAADAKATGDALALRPTKAQLDAGWWSVWTILRDGVDVTAQVQQPECISDTGGDEWYVYVVSTDERASSPREYDADALELSWKGVDSSEVFHEYTATRHRVSAPVPTKPEDIGAASTNDVMLTPVYSQTPTYGNDWTFSGTEPPTGYHYECYWSAADDFWILSKVSDSDPTDREGIYYAGTSPTDTTLHFIITGYDVTATRVRTDIIGYILGSQTDRPLQPKGDYQPAGSYASPSDIGIPAFSTTATYVYGNLVVRSNAVWECQEPSIVPGEWIDNYWRKLFDLDTGAPVSGGTKLITNGQVQTALDAKADAEAVAPAYDATAAYSVGDVVTHDGRRYVCNTAIATGGEAWTAAHWTLTDVETELAAKAPLASPAFTGTPTAPTPTAGDNSTKVATTAFVQGEGANKLDSASAAPAWVSNAVYTANALVTYNGVIYCNTNGGTFVSDIPPSSDTNWKEKKVSELFLPLTGGEVTGPLTLKRGVAAGGDAAFYGDGIRNLDNNAVYAWPTKSGNGKIALTAGMNHSGNLAALDEDGNPTDSTIPAANVAVKGNIPYDLVTITTGQLQDHAVQEVTLSAATTTLVLPALTSGKVSDFGIDVVNAYEESGTPAAASISLSGTIGTDYNIITADGDDFSEMTALAAGEMAEYYFTLTAFALGGLPTWRVYKQTVKQYTPAVVTP